MALSTFIFILLMLLGPVWSGDQGKSAASINSTGSSITKPRDSGAAALLETGEGSPVKTRSLSPTEIRVVSYNIRWRSGNDLDKIIKLLKEDREIGNATMLGLQEVDRSKKRSNNTNTVKRLAQELHMHYAWTAPPVANGGDEEETGVAILSPYPLTEVTRLLLPHEGPNRRRRVALGATVEIGATKFRFYSIHSETRIATHKKLEQMNAVIQDLDRHPKEMPAIILGDFNTWEADADRKTIKLFTDAGFVTPFGAQPTFSRRILFIPLELRLDWIWLRGLTAVTYGVDRKISISDHWPLWANLKRQPQAK